MNDDKLLTRKKIKTIFPEIMLKVTALQYFSEALYREKYEECDDLIKFAVGLGAQKREIKTIIEAYVKRVKGMRGLEAVLNPQKGSRL